MLSNVGVWKGIAVDAIVMNTDDLLCVGALDHILLSSTIGRNKHSTITQPEILGCSQTFMLIQTPCY